MWASELPSSSSSGGGDTSRSIVAAEVRDPYILLQLSDGSAALLGADAASCRLAVVEAPALQLAEGQGRVTACSLYSDSCGWLQQHAAAADSAGEGGSGSSGSMYCGVCRTGGAFQLYSLPSWQLVFACDGLAQGPALLSSSGAGSRAAAAAEGEVAEVVELRLASFGPVAAGRHDPAAARASKAPACEAPVLLALTADHQLLAYRAFTPGGARSSSSGSGSLKGGLAFRRLPLDVPPLMPPAAGEQQQGGEVQPAWRLQRLHSFEGLGEEAPYSGLFVAGVRQLFDAWMGMWVSCMCYKGCWPAAAVPCKPPGVRAAAQLVHGTLPAAIPTNCRAAPALAGGQPRQPGGAPSLPAAACGIRPRGASAGLRCSGLHPFPQRQLPPWLHRGHQCVGVGVCCGRLSLADLPSGSTTAELDRHAFLHVGMLSSSASGGPCSSWPTAVPFHTGGARSGIQISQLPARTRLDAPWPRQVRPACCWIRASWRTCRSVPVIAVAAERLSSVLCMQLHYPVPGCLHAASLCHFVGPCSVLRSRAHPCEWRTMPRRTCLPCWPAARWVGACGAGTVEGLVSGGAEAQERRRPAGCAQAFVLPPHSTYLCPLLCPQVPFKAFLPEEEESGEPQASYSYALAEATARARGTMQGHEVRLLWGWLSGLRPALLVIGGAAGMPFPCLDRALWHSVNVLSQCLIKFLDARLCPAGAPGVARRRVAGSLVPPAAAGRASALSGGSAPDRSNHGRHSAAAGGGSCAACR